MVYNERLNGNYGMMEINNGNAKNRSRECDKMKMSK